MKGADDMLWWGYVHKNESIQVKRFFGKRDIEEAKKSPFCLRVFDSFVANGREDAIVKIKEKMKEF